MDGVRIGAVEHHVDAESAFTAGRKPEVELGAVTFLSTGESLHALHVFGNSAETEVLEADDTAVGDAYQIHVVVPVIPGVLHPVVARHVAGVSGRIISVWIESENLEALAGYLSTRIFVAVAGFGRPFIVLGKRVIAYDAHLSTLSHGLLVPFYLDWGHHRLTGIAEATGRTVIEHIPLAVDFLQRTVGVVGGIGSDKL